MAKLRSMPIGPTLVGRTEESGALAALLDDLARGVGGLAWVEGEPGIGKTTLVRHRLAIASTAGFSTLVGAAEEMGWRSPLEAIRTAFDQLPLAAPPETRTQGLAAPGDPIVRAAETLIDNLEGACAAGPVVVCLEDLQWADGASLALWERLAPLTRQRPLVLVATCRSLPHRDDVNALRAQLSDLGATMLSLGPLSEVEVSRLVAIAVGGLPGPELLSLVAHAGGNPFYVGEVLDAVDRENMLLRIGDGSVDLAPGWRSGTGLPTLNRAITQRLRFLSDDVREVMQAAAIAGASFDLATVAALVPSKSDGLEAAVAAALAGGVLVEDDRSLRFRHELVRQALLDQIPSAVQCAFHYQLAQHLVANGAQPTVVAGHIVAAAEAIDYWLIGWLTGEGETLCYRMPQIAVDLVSRVFALLAPSPTDTERLRAQLVRTLFVLGRYDELDRVAEELVASTKDPVLIGEMTWYRASSLIRTAKVQQALAALDDALVGETQDVGFVARMLAARATALGNLGRGDEAIESATRALSLGERHDDRLAMGTALNALSYVRNDRRQSRAAIEDITKALDITGDDLGCADLRLVLLTNYLGPADDQAAEETEAIAAQLLEEGERAASPMRLSAIRTMVASIWYSRGRFDDAFAVLEALDFAGLRAAPSELVRARGVLAAVAAHRGELALASNELNHVAQIDPGAGEGSVNLMYAVYAKAMLAEQSGDLATALSVLTERMATTVDRRFGQALVWLPDAVRLAKILGQTPTAERATQECQEIVDDISSPRALASMRRCLALLESNRDCALEAVDLLRGMPWRGDLARAHEDASVLLAAAGDVDQARVHLNAATDICADMGAAWDMRRAAARLRAVGIRQGVRGPRGRPSAGWAALTPTERRVAMQVAVGRTNPEIATTLLLSRRTVETHVSHILSKLGVKSRLDIARESVGREG